MSLTDEYARIGKSVAKLVVTDAKVEFTLRIIMQSLWMIFQRTFDKKGDAPIKLAQMLVEKFKRHPFACLGRLHASVGSTFIRLLFSNLELYVESLGAMYAGFGNPVSNQEGLRKLGKINRFCSVAAVFVGFIAEKVRRGIEQCDKSKSK
ncbi:hypothetical protein HDU76_008293 [Blyttiomyces sp. JEL0837]|nr:hypothetical protein HDU76_008293 [Blyttiomyces sp. JEL0837]